MTLTDMPRRPRDPRGKRMETYHGKRQGAILVVVLVCLILVVAVVANLVRGLWLRQQEGREALSRLQLEILVSDVLAAASARGLAAEGESPPASLYEVSPEAWGLAEAGLVRVSYVTEETGQRLLLAEGELRDGETIQQRMTKSIILK
ncbi:MAG: hypothetical protein KDA76_14205 [Planctomycetaceae bacterium]|nr:hypothetical protein [Planctomycetaceae bacterium]